MDLNDFYPIETPPSSSTSKDSIDEFLLPLRNRKLNRSSTTTSMNFNDEIQLRSYLTDEMQTPLRRTLGNTKLKTRQDVRRFRKFLKRNYDFQTISLVEIDPETLKNYLIHYLTSIRTRKGSQYDPETLRSYYLSIQRFLKDSNYPFCLRNSPQFAQCRDLIIQMRKEKHQNKFSEPKAKRSNEKKSIVEENPKNANIFSQKSVSSKDLPSSSLPLRKRQEMKYFLEPQSLVELSNRFPNPVSLFPREEIRQKSTNPISTDAMELLRRFSRIDAPNRVRPVEYFHDLLDQSSDCGSFQRLMLTSLCRQWTGDIRLIHSNLRPDLNSFLPHVLVISILSSNDAL